LPVQASVMDLPRLLSKMNALLAEPS